MVWNQIHLNHPGRTDSLCTQLGTLNEQSNMTRLSFHHSTALPPPQSSPHFKVWNIILICKHYKVINAYLIVVGKSFRLWPQSLKETLKRWLSAMMGNQPKMVVPNSRRARKIISFCIICTRTHAHKDTQISISSLPIFLLCGWLRTWIIYKECLTDCTMQYRVWI